MPVTVMHDPRTAVGLIADTKLLTRAKDNVPRSRIDSTLGIWAHRFPEIAAEIDANYASGDLMQSMECLPTHYDCTACGKRFPKLPGGAEKAQWCACLRGETAQKGARALGNVTFTGTGLIFGHRGATALYRPHTSRSSRRRSPSSTRRPVRTGRTHHVPRGGIAAWRSRTGSTSSSSPTAPSATGSRRSSRPRRPRPRRSPTSSARSRRRRRRRSRPSRSATRSRPRRRRSRSRRASQTLAKERLGALGSDFLGKFGEFAKGKLEEQAGKLDDAAWDDYLKEREEMAGVARDAGEKGGAAPSGGSGGGSGDGTFTREEVARSGAGGGGGGTSTTPSAPSDTKRRSVVAGLVRKPEPATK
jgi:hypothetical protein